VDFPVRNPFLIAPPNPALKGEACGEQAGPGVKGSRVYFLTKPKSPANNIWVLGSQTEL
jgi:hypothetical protein